MSNASCYPCPFCLGFRLTYEGEDTLRTFWHIVHYGDQWTALAEGDRNEGKHYYCCVGRPLIGDGEDIPVLYVVVPPALHLKLGLNTVLKNLRLLWDDMEQWMRSNLQLDFKPYHGTTLEGGDCSHFLDNLDTVAAAIPEDCQVFLPFFRAFKKVIDGCFGMYELDPLYKTYIAEFKTSLEAMNAELPFIAANQKAEEKEIAGKKKHKVTTNVTVKQHTIITHVPQFCDKFGLPIGRFSEQALERSHHLWAERWKRYIVKDDERDIYDENLLKAGLEYNYDQIQIPS